MNWLSDQMCYIHLDFHTPTGVNVASNFDEKKFVEILKKTGADSIAIFAKDHYGHAYYPSRLGNFHPDLKLNLFGEMLSACHKAGLRVFAYLSIGWDNLSAQKFPEWQQVNKKGEPILAGNWRSLCLNSPYVNKRIFPQIREVLENYDVDGLWLDIVFFMEGACYCPFCLQKMESLNLDPNNEYEHLLFNDTSVREFISETYNFAKKIKPDVAVSFNNLVKIGARTFLPHLDYWWIEALPHGWGLYYLPLYSRYLRTLGKPMAGLTARFHKSWGDFGSLKPLQHLLWEAGEMLINGAAVGIGDQMNPDGTLEEAVYDMIGEVFRFVREREKWCKGAKSVPYVAVLSPKQIGTTGMGKPSEALLGAVAMLMELHIHFDIIDEEGDFAPYTLLILPDVSTLSPSAINKVIAFLKAGGSVFLSLQPQVSSEISPLLGKNIRIEPASFSICYIRLNSFRLREGIPPMDMIVWQRPALLKRAKGKELASTIAPLMERTPEHFFSHAQAPSGIDTHCPAILLKPIGKGKLLVFAVPIFTDFHKNNYAMHKQLFKNAFEMLVSRRKRLLEVDAPQNIEVSLMQKDNAFIIHLLNLNINRKGNLCDEFIAPGRVGIKLRLSHPPKQVYYAPSELPLPRWQWLENPREGSGFLKARVRIFNTHTIIVVEV